jgi:hypothetical protein
VASGPYTALYAAKWPTYRPNAQDPSSHTNVASAAPGAKKIRPLPAGPNRYNSPRAVTTNTTIAANPLKPTRNFSCVLSPTSVITTGIRTRNPIASAAPITATSVMPSAISWNFTSPLVSRSP